MFDACSGDCDEGEAAGTTLTAVDVAVADGAVHLTDDAWRYRHDGGVDDSDPSTSHVGF